MRKNRIAVYPGSFDPVTNGHIDIIKRAARLFDRAVVAVIENPTKAPLFSTQERIQLLKESLDDIQGIKVAHFHGLLVDFLKGAGAQVIVRGLRAISDFEVEFQMALMNRKLAPEIETIFLMPDETYTYLSSSIVKEIAKLGGDISSFVPARVRERLNKVFG